MSNDRVCFDLARDAELTCPNCAGHRLDLFYGIRSIPVYDCLLMATRAEALGAPTGDLRLGFCGSCGFITNTEFDVAVTEYSGRYEETQGFSGTFSAFAKSLATGLIERYGLRHKKVLEIGCGKGEFLMLLCQLGPNDGVGIDPSWLPGRLPPEVEARIEFRREFYAPEHAAIATDFICCRHTLEHIAPTAEFVQQIRDTVRDDSGTPIWFEVPDVLRVLNEGAFWDIYYEHCSYFTLGSLARLFRRCRMSLCELGLDYDDQYLVVGGMPESTPDDRHFPGEDDLHTVRAAVEQFGVRCREMVDGWRQTITAIRADGGRPVVWGAGSKCVAFMSTLGLGDAIEYAVDINPHKAGKFVPGAGTEVVPPSFLPSYQPTHAIAMNPIYLPEIEAELQRQGVTAEVLPVTRPG